MRVHIITSTELGWDCIVDVVDADLFTEEQVREAYPCRTNIITTQTVSVELDRED